MGSLLYNLSTVNKTINRNYTFKDIALDVAVTSNNRDIQADIDYAAVQNGIENMFLFLQGERVLIPDFGNSIYKYLYEPINNVTETKIRDEINLMFQKWEPRVHIHNISIRAEPDQNTYYLTILYSVPALSKTNTLVWNKAINIRR